MNTHAQAAKPPCSVCVCVCVCVCPQEQVEGSKVALLPPSLVLSVIYELTPRWRRVSLSQERSTRAERSWPLSSGRLTSRINISPLISRQRERAHTHTHTHTQSRGRGHSRLAEASREQKVEEGRLWHFVCDLEASQAEIKMLTFITDEIIFMWAVKSIKRN